MKLYNKKEAALISIVGFAIVAATLLTGCGKPGLPGAAGAPGASGAKGDQGYGAGVLAEAVAGLCGATDGVRITTFQDKNNNGLKELDESINAVTSVCNGSNGHDGSNGSNGQNGTSSTTSISLVAPSCGAAGGYTMTVVNGSVSSSYPICNGNQGIQGSPGLQGIPGTNGTNGANGLDGKNGSTVTPVKFCKDDKSTYPEYGLYIDGRLFAVYWGSTPASSASQAFLAEILPGSYKSTGGNNCAFTITDKGYVQ